MPSPNRKSFSLVAVAVAATMIAAPAPAFAEGESGQAAQATPQEEPAELIHCSMSGVWTVRLSQGSVPFLYDFTVSTTGQCPGAGRTAMEIVGIVNGVTFTGVSTCNGATCSVSGTATIVCISGSTYTFFAGSAIDGVEPNTDTDIWVADAAYTSASNKSCQ